MPNHILPLPYFEMFFEGSWYILDVLDQNYMRFTLHKNKHKNILFRNIKIHFLLHQNLGAQNPIGKYLMRI